MKQKDLSALGINSDLGEMIAPAQKIFEERFIIGLKDEHAKPGKKILFSLPKQPDTTHRGRIMSVDGNKMLVSSNGEEVVIEVDGSWGLDRASIRLDKQRESPDQLLHTLMKHDLLLGDASNIATPLDRYNKVCLGKVGAALVEYSQLPDKD